MRIISQGKTAVRKILGTQKQKNCICRKMRYVVEAKDGKDLLLLNTVTGELARLEEAEAAAWQSLTGTVPESLEELYKRHYLVPEDYNERKTVEQIRTVLRLTKKAGEITSFIILPTTACNARCFYCYESGYPHHTMTEETAEAAARFMIKSCGSKRKVKIQWFGGEPLVGRNRIAQICRILQEEEMELTSQMTTNGYLFTPELVREAKELWKLKNVQITLDGTEEIYNRTKAYAGVAGSPYLRVLDNIGSLLDAGIHVSVRMNLDRHNEKDLEKLVDELAARFSGREGLTCYVHELFDQQGFEPIRHTEEELEELSRRRIELEHRILAAELARGGKARPLPALAVNFCMADSSNSLLINPLGELGKCEHVPYDPPLGDIRTGVTDRKGLNKWLQSTFEDACAACELYPYCARMTTCPTKDPCREAARREKLAMCRRRMLEERGEEAKEDTDCIDSPDC